MKPDFKDYILAIVLGFVLTALALHYFDVLIK
jgi:hypothetical protein